MQMKLFAKCWNIQEKNCLHKDGSYSVPYISEKVCEYSGFKPEQVITEPSLFFQPIHHDDIGHIQEQIQKSAENLSEFSVEHRITTPSGEIKWFRVKSTPTLLENGDILWNGISIDITERKHNEQYYKILAEMLDTAPNAITIHDFSGYILFANRIAYEIHGYEELEFKALNLRNLDVPESAALIEERMNIVNEKGKAFFTVGHKRKDGSTIPMEVTVKKVVWENEPALMSIATDITERKQAEAALRQSQNFISNILETTPNLIYIYDLQENLNVYSSSGLIDIIGYTAQEIKEQGDRLFANILHPEDFAVVSAHYERLASASDDHVQEVEYRMSIPRATGYSCIVRTSHIFVMIKGKSNR